jgi:hypothetical protein
MHAKFRKLGTVSSVIDFLEAIKMARDKFSKLRDHRGNHDITWFRGQHQTSWSLKPKLYRPEFIKADETEIRDLFQSRALQLVHSRKPADKWEWYFLMQHHGAPTRLLDWTENPLIALFFAVKHHNYKEDAAVWLLDPYWLNHQNTFLEKKDISGPILPSWRESNQYLFDLEKAFEGKKIRTKFPAAIQAPHIDIRLHAQESRFVVFGKDHDLKEMFKIPKRKLGLARISISAKHVQRIEDELAVLGIHAASVFPELDGLGEFVCDQWMYQP